MDGSIVQSCQPMRAKQATTSSFPSHDRSLRRRCDGEVVVVSGAGGVVGVAGGGLRGRFSLEPGEEKTDKMESLEVVDEMERLVFRRSRMMKDEDGGGEVDAAQGPASAEVSKARR
nr:hypothetical protein CFP56_25781 [Quercus suber]